MLEALHKAGKTILVITHDLAELGPLVSRAIVLGVGHEASVRYDGPPPVPANFDEHVHHHHASSESSRSIGLEA